MPQRDLHSELNVVQLLNPAVVTNTAGGTPANGLDTRDYRAAEIIVAIGESGDTLSGANKIDIVLEESDDDATYTPVTETLDVLVGSNPRVAAPNASGIVATIDAASEDDHQFRVGYRGDKRYVRSKAVLTGSHTNGTPIAMLGVLARSGGPQADA